VCKLARARAYGLKQCIASSVLVLVLQYSIIDHIDYYRQARHVQKVPVRTRTVLCCSASSIEPIRLFPFQVKYSQIGKCRRPLSNSQSFTRCIYTGWDSESTRLFRRVLGTRSSEDKSGYSIGAGHVLHIYILSDLKSRYDSWAFGRNFVFVFARTGVR
jgi:hypothetical protein